MPTCYMLAGIPGAGKSTWIAKQPFDWAHTVIASTDNYLDAQSKSLGLTYDEVHKSHFKAAEKQMLKVVSDAIRNGEHIIWDQTNITKGSRAKKLNMLPDDYQVIGVVFNPPSNEELARRLASRPGKTIPKKIIASMTAQWEEPTESEGFDKIIYVG